MKKINTTGKRKRSIAKATASAGKGLIIINQKPLEMYEPEIARLRILEPLTIAGDKAKKLDIDVKVKGGGWNSQAEASRLAIARALVEFDKGLKQPFLAYDRQLLIADVRRKETRKPNDSKARAKRQKSYR